MHERIMRDNRKSIEYFTKNISVFNQWIVEDMPVVESFHRLEGRAGMAHSLCRNAVHLCVLRYGVGDAIEDIRPSVWQWIEAREIEGRVLASLPADLQSIRTMYEKVTLDTVYDALTMMAFATALHFKPAEMSRLLSAIGHAGEDALIDEAAKLLGDTQRVVAVDCKYPKVYSPLLAVWKSEPEHRAQRLQAFATDWKKKMKPIYWSNSLEGADGAYFGYWCFDIALAVMLLQIPDDALRSNPYYPTELVECARRR